MEYAGKISGGKITREQIKLLGVELGRDFVSVALQEARALAVDLGRYTAPFGMMVNDGNALKMRIKNEIEQLFPSIDDGAMGAVRIYSLLEQTSEKAAKAFWSAHKAGDREAMENVLAKRITGLPRRIDRAGHKAARTGKYARVRKNAKALAIVNSRTRDAYVRRQQKKAGMAKAGWLGAARGLGGRVRRGGGRDGGTSEVFPPWVRKAGARRKLGSAVVSAGSSKIQIMLRNAVRHAEEALPHAQQLAAESRAELRFIQSLLKARSYRTNRARRNMRRRA